MLGIGIIIDTIEVTTLILWITKGEWLPFVLGMGIIVILGIWISAYYFKRVAYICPQCHIVFRPRFKEALFARHTPSLRRLTCTKCGRHGFCIETYADLESKTKLQ